MTSIHAFNRKIKVCQTWNLTHLNLKILQYYIILATSKMHLLDHHIQHVPYFSE